MSFEIRALYENEKKYGTARQATDDSLMQRWEDAICRLDSWGKNTGTHSHTLVIQKKKKNTPWFQVVIK
jgi:hypothetical protein